MNDHEVRKFLVHLSGGWPERVVTPAAERFWQNSLSAVTLDDALAAVDALVSEGQEHYPRPAQVLARCPDRRLAATGYGRYAELRRKYQGGRGDGAYRCDGVLTPTEKDEYAALSRQLGVTL